MRPKNHPEVWQKGPTHPVLAPGEIHLWLASIETTWPLIQLEEMSDLERTKLGTLKNEDVRKQFGVSQWLTRHLLARYCEARPTQIHFGISEHGKPFLETLGPEMRNLEFNRSHSSGWIVLAMSEKTPVGVDMESKIRSVDMEAIAERWFEREERDNLSNLADLEKPDYFYRCWTRKEAVFKAWGVGISHLSEYAEFEQKTWRKDLSIDSNLVGCVAAAANKASHLKIIHYHA